MKFSELKFEKLTPLQHDHFKLFLNENDKDYKDKYIWFCYNYPYRVFLRTVFNKSYFIPFEYEYKTFIKISEKYPIETYKLVRYKSSISYIVKYNLLKNEWYCKTSKYRVPIDMGGLEPYFHQCRNGIYYLELMKMYMATKYLLSNNILIHDIANYIISLSHLYYAQYDIYYHEIL